MGDGHAEAEGCRGGSVYSVDGKRRCDLLRTTLPHPARYEKKKQECYMNASEMRVETASFTASK